MNGPFADSSPVVFIEHTAERKMAEQGMTPCAVSLLYEDDCMGTIQVPLYHPVTSCTELTILGHKLHRGTFKTIEFVSVQPDFPLF